MADPIKARAVPFRGASKNVYPRITLAPQLPGNGPQVFAKPGLKNFDATSIAILAGATAVAVGLKVLESKMRAKRRATIRAVRAARSRSRSRAGGKGSGTGGAGRG